MLPLESGERKKERDFVDSQSSAGKWMRIVFARFTGTKVIKMAFLVVVVNHLELFGFCFSFVLPK